MNEIRLLSIISNLADILYEHLDRDDQKRFGKYLLDAGFTEKEINENFDSYLEDEQ